MSYIWLFDIWPSIVALTLSWHMGITKSKGLNGNIIIDKLYVECQ